MRNAAILAAVPFLEANLAYAHRLLFLAENWQGRPLLPDEFEQIRKTVTALESSLTDLNRFLADVS